MRLLPFSKYDKVTKPLVVADLNREYRLLGQLPWSIIILLIGLVAAYFIYNRTTVGLNIRAIGGNKEVAKALGINEIKTLLWVGVICGMFIGVALSCSRATGPHHRKNRFDEHVYGVPAAGNISAVPDPAKKNKYNSSRTHMRVYYICNIQSLDYTGESPPAQCRKRFSVPF